MAIVDDKAIIQFLRRAYFAVDGLWFVRLEEEHSYEEALRLDEQVWEILPKIQARKARELLGIEGHSLADLGLGLWLKFASEGYEHKVIERTSHVLRICIETCPWLEIMKKTSRVSKAAEVCDRICTRDFAVWAREFSDQIDFSLESKLSEGCNACELLFTVPLEADILTAEDMEAAG